MNPVIVGCSNLQDNVAAAQAAMNTNIPEYWLERKLHVDPELMKNKISEMIKNLPEEYDTVLLALGFCGGSLGEVSFDRTVVIPRVDDCVSLLLCTDENYIANRKETGHLYMMEADPKYFSVMEMYEWSKPFYHDMPDDILFQVIFGNYHHLDIIDTGLTDCYSEDYVMEAQRNADMIQAVLDFVPGSNLLLEKLVSGRWDEQFMVIEPGRVIHHGDFFE